MPVHEIESVFLDVIEGTVLHPDFIDHFVDGHAPDNGVMLAERNALATEITNLTTAIAHGGNIPALAPPWPSVTGHEGSRRETREARSGT